MGFGLPAAIGAKVACPESTVVCISGDGSFQMCTQELMTASVYELPVISIICNNHSLGMVRQWQDLFYKQRISQTSLEASPDFVKLAEAYGCVGIRVEKPEEVRPAIEAALKVRKKPVVIECIIPTEENVYPMIPAGESVSEMKQRTDLEELKASLNTDSEAWSFSEEDKVLSEYVEEAESVQTP